MTLNHKYVHSKFKLNGFNYAIEDLKGLASNFLKSGSANEKQIALFLENWFNNDDYIELKTSGSTGKPKDIKVKKQAMINSAVATGTFFNLKPGNTALHCLPSQYIAGKMMLVRALVLGLEIDVIEPALHLKINPDKHYNFSAMVPLQIENVYKNCNNIDTIIVGGSPVSSSLKSKLTTINTSVFETYGMTETVSHIALKKLTSSENYFKILPNVSISLDHRGCLVIDAPLLNNDKIITNDLVKIHSETTFEWLGRFDNVVNSGGVKLFPEQIEAKLQNKIQNRFFIASQPDDTLGSKLILVIESDSNILNDSVFSELSKFEKPKTIYAVKQFIETASGKIQRKKTLNLISF